MGRVGLVVKMAWRAGVVAEAVVVEVDVAFEGGGCLARTAGRRMRVVVMGRRDGRRMVWVGNFSRVGSVLERESDWCVL